MLTRADGVLDPKGILFAKERFHEQIQKASRSTHEKQKWENKNQEKENILPGRGYARSRGLAAFSGVCRLSALESKG